MARVPATRWTTDTDVHADNVNLIMTQIEAEIDDVAAAIPSIENDLTTGGVDKALSAEMGKQLKTEVGDLTALPTVEKTNLVGAVAEVFTYGSSFKSDVATAITAKGVATQATDTKETFVANIAAIQSGGGEDVPHGEGRMDVYEGTRTTSGSAYAGFAICIYPKEDIWITAVKQFLLVSDASVTLNIRKGSGAIAHTQSNISTEGSVFNNIPLSVPVKLLKDGYYMFEFLFSAPQKLSRTTNTLYNGSLWGCIGQRINNILGEQFKETGGFGLVEFTANA